jgi:hypothetical protein
MAPPGALSQPFRSRWDHEFESVFLQRRVGSELGSDRDRGRGEGEEGGIRRDWQSGSTALRMRGAFSPIRSKFDETRRSADC